MRTGRAADVTAPTARYPFEVLHIPLYAATHFNSHTSPSQVTLHQGAIENIFLDSMASMGVQVERPIVPTSIQLSADKADLKDPHSHPVKVVLKYLASEEGRSDTEVVNAKFVIGADGKTNSIPATPRDFAEHNSLTGAHSWVRKSFDIAMEGEQTSASH